MRDALLTVLAIVFWGCATGPEAAAPDDSDAGSEVPDLAPSRSALVIATDGNGNDRRWSNTDKMNLTYCVERGGASPMRDGFGADTNRVIDAVNWAASEWEKVARVDFKLVASDGGSNVCDTRARCDCPGTPTFRHVDALFRVVPTAPGSGQITGPNFLPDLDIEPPHRLLRINRGGPRFRDRLDELMLHELGHVLGFLHEHDRLDAIATPDEVACRERGFRRGFGAVGGGRPLTPYDALSALHYPSNGDATPCGGRIPRPYFDLSDHDAMAAACIYGKGSSNNPPSYCTSDWYQPTIASMPEYWNSAATTAVTAW